MRKLKPKSISRILKKRDSLTNQYFDHAFSIMQADKILSQLLPAPLEQHCHIANFSQQELIVAVDSPAWSSRVRFHSPDILRKMNNDYGYAFKKIRVLVQPKSGRPTHPAKSKPKLSPESAACIEETAQSISDPKLRDSLLRLSRRSEKK